jgi:hypothetical protein
MVDTMHLLAKSNEYADMLHPLYDNIPKTVMAAIAVSFAIQLKGEEDFEYFIKKRIMEEWEILHQNGIVPQKPPKKKVTT